MTIANQITIARILLIPVFVLFAAYYGAGVARGEPEEWIRYCAVGIFIFAAVTDAFDGWVARKLGETSKLGAILDPIADKGLLLTAIITLTISPWHFALPLWFPVLVIARDVVILTGCAVVQLHGNNLVVRPMWTGKSATALQMIAVSWVLLQIPYFEPVIWLAGALTLISGIEYIFQGVRQFTHSENEGVTKS